MEWRKRGEPHINLSHITGCEGGEIERKIIHGHQHSSDALNNSLMLVLLDLLHYPIYVTLYKGYGYEYNTGYRDYGDYGTPLFKKQLGFITKWQRG